MNASLTVFSYFSILYQLPREKSTLSGESGNPPSPAGLPQKTAGDLSGHPPRGGAYSLYALLVSMYMPRSALQPT